MRLFSRTKVAKRLEVTPGRVSQLAAEGEMIPAVEEEDGTARGWPETYVEEVVARRSGRETSRSIFGFPPDAAGFTRAGDVVVDGGRNGRYFVQLLRVKAGTIGLLMRLDTLSEHDLLEDEVVRNYHPFTVDGDALVPLIHQAAAEFEVDPYDVAWVELRDIEAVEVFLGSEEATRAAYNRRPWSNEEYTDTANVERIGWDILRSKLGERVPVLDVRVQAAVEAWQQAGRTTGILTLDADKYHNTAVAAAVLAERAAAVSENGYSRTSADVSQSLRLAATRLAAQIPWELSGEPASSFLVDTEPENVQRITRTHYPEFAEFREAIEKESLEDGKVSTEAAQDAVNILAQRLYREHGPYGEKPDAVLAYALERGMSSIQSPMRGEPFGRDVLVPRFYSVRQFDVDESRVSWWEYFTTSLHEARDSQTPESRQLRELTSRAGSVERPEGPGKLMVDRDGNYAMVTRIVSYNGSSMTRVTVLVPTAGVCHRDLGAVKEFDEILVEPSAMSGPVMLRVGDDVHVMPFGRATNQSFTHGYSGGGPADLTNAIRYFLEWVVGAPMTDEGRHRISAQVTGANGGRLLRLDGEDVRRLFYYASPETEDDD